MLAEIVEDLDDSLNKALLDLGSIEQDQLKFEGHRTHHLFCHGPIRCDAAPQNTDHI